MTAIASMGGNLIKLHVQLKKLEFTIKDGGQFVWSTTFPDNTEGAAGKSKMHFFFTNIVDPYLYATN